MSTESIFRVAFLVVMVSNFGVSGYFRSRARRGEEIPRSAESKGLRLMRVAFTLPLLVAVLGYLTYPPAIAWASVSLDVGWRWCGVVLGLALVPWMVWVFRAIGSNVSETVLIKKTHQLVTVGPYRWVRHPIYTTGIAMILSFAMISANLLFAGIAIVAVPLFRFAIVPREEAALIERFGEQYEAYRGTTGALIPRLWAR